MDKARVNPFIVGAVRVQWRGGAVDISVVPSLSRQSQAKEDLSSVARSAKEDVPPTRERLSNNLITSAKKFSQSLRGVLHFISRLVL
jgi:hypothetical protein